MTLKTKHDVGLLGMIPEGGIYVKSTKGQQIATLSKIHSSTSCHYINPSKVAPQQSFGPLHITVTTKMIILNNYLTLSFPHR